MRSGWCGCQRAGSVDGPAIACKVGLASTRTAPRVPIDHEQAEGSRNEAVRSHFSGWKTPFNVADVVALNSVCHSHNLCGRSDAIGSYPPIAD